jgi:hypothetical protein
MKRGDPAMHGSSVLKRSAASAGVLLIPLALLLAGLAAQLAQPRGRFGAHPAAHDLTMDVDTAVRWLLVTGLLAIGGLAVTAVLRRR